DGARAKPEEALPLAQGLEVCAVRINLAIVVERLGDAAVADGDGAGGAQHYGGARLVPAETAEECSSPQADEQSPDPGRRMSDSLEDLEDRLQEKQQQSEQPPPPPQEEEAQEEEQPQPGEDQLKDLQDRLQQGAEEREQRQQDEDDGPGGGTDKPW